MVSHVTTSTAAPLDRLPAWITLVCAPNPGPMTLDGTNTWLLRPRGEAAAVVVDPGPLIESHLTEVARLGPVGTVLVTHSHPDHVEGVARFLQLTGAVVASSDPFAGETDAQSVGGVRITAIPTPGHTADSVCFLAEYAGEQVILTGDTILGRGTTVVAYPDGDLEQYLTSLRLLSRYAGVPALPGHGPALTDTATAAAYYLRHRLARLDQVRAATDTGAQTASEVVAVVYADVDRSLWPAAELSVRAQLAYLAAHRESTAGGSELDPP